MPKCLICKQNTTPIFNFGKMPIANGFLSKEQFEKEYFYTLQLDFCTSCKMVQLHEQPPKEQMFHENYAFLSSSSKGMLKHFELTAKYVISNYLVKDNPFVVEIGSNDGSMLKHFALEKIKHLGIEPSENVADIANIQGYNTINEFFDKSLAKQIKSKYGEADIIIGTNVMCHISDILSILDGIKILLKPTGVLIFEDPYLLDIIQKTSYDQIYDEHAFYFSATSVFNMLLYHNLEIIDVSTQEVHGGSMRYVVAHKGAYKPKDMVNSCIRNEDLLGLNELDVYRHLKRNIELSKEILLKQINDANKENKRVVGYAATSKSTTVLNYCNITPNMIEYICDTTEIKQGKYSPGMHIPIVPYEKFKENYPDYALLFGWNHAREIIPKEQDFTNKGGKWIVYTPV